MTNIKCFGVATQSIYDIVRQQASRDHLIVFSTNQRTQRGGEKTDEPARRYESFSFLMVLSRLTSVLEIFSLSSGDSPDCQIPVRLLLMETVQ